MSDEYVRKDLYDEGIKRIEAMMAASEAKHRQYTDRVIAKFERDTDRILARFERDTDSMADAINAVRDKQDAYERKHDRFINYMSILATACGVIVALAQLYLAFKG